VVTGIQKTIIRYKLINNVFNNASLEIQKRIKFKKTITRFKYLDERKTEKNGQ